MKSCALAVKREMTFRKDSWLWVGFALWEDGAAKEGPSWKKARRETHGMLRMGMRHRMQFGVVRAENAGSETGTV